MKKSSIDNAREHSTNKFYVNCVPQPIKLFYRVNCETGEWGNLSEMFVEFFFASLCVC